MLSLFRYPDRYGQAVRSTAEQLVAAHGMAADQEAWRAARMDGLNDGERAFCRAVAEAVTGLLGRTPDVAR